MNRRVGCESCDSFPLHKIRDEGTYTEKIIKKQIGKETQRR